jgi:hypothetical protein
MIYVTNVSGGEKEGSAQGRDWYYMRGSGCDGEECEGTRPFFFTNLRKGSDVKEVMSLLRSSVLPILHRLTHSFPKFSYIHT